MLNLIGGVTLYVLKNDFLLKHKLIAVIQLRLHFENCAVQCRRKVRAAIKMRSTRARNGAEQFYLTSLSVHNQYWP